MLFHGGNNRGGGGAGGTPGGTGRRSGPPTTPSLTPSSSSPGQALLRQQAIQHFPVSSPRGRGMPNREQVLLRSRVLQHTAQEREALRAHFEEARRVNLDRRNQYLRPNPMATIGNAAPDEVFLVRYHIQLLDDTWRTQFMLAPWSEIVAHLAPWLSADHRPTLADLRLFLRLCLEDDPARYTSYNGEDIPELAKSWDEHTRRHLPVVGSYLQVQTQRDHQRSPSEIRHILEDVNFVPPTTGPSGWRYARATTHCDQPLHTSDDHMDLDEEDDNEMTHIVQGDNPDDPEGNSFMMDLSGIDLLLDVWEELEQECGPIHTPRPLAAATQLSSPVHEDGRVAAPSSPPDSPLVGPIQSPAPLTALDPLPRMLINNDANVDEDVEDVPWGTRSHCPGLKEVSLPMEDLRRITDRPRPTPCPQPDCRGHCVFEILARILLASRAHRYTTVDHRPTTEALDAVIHDEIFPWFQNVLGKTSPCEGLSSREINAWCCRHVTPEKPFARHTFICISPLREIVDGVVVPQTKDNKRLLPIIIAMTDDHRHVVEVTIDSERRRYEDVLIRQRDAPQANASRVAHRLCQSKKGVVKGDEKDDDNDDDEDEKSEEEEEEEGDGGVDTPSSVSPPSGSDEDNGKGEGKKKEPREAAKKKKKRATHRPGDPPLSVLNPHPILSLPEVVRERVIPFVFDPNHFTIPGPLFGDSEDLIETEAATGVPPPPNTRSTAPARTYLPTEWTESVPHGDGISDLDYDPMDLAQGGGNRFVYDFCRPFYLPLPGDSFHPRKHPTWCTPEEVAQRRKRYLEHFKNEYPRYVKRLTDKKRKWYPPLPYYIMICTNLRDLLPLLEWIERVWPASAREHPAYRRSHLHDPAPRTLVLQNVLWVALPDYLPLLRPLHLKLCPSEPFQALSASIARYAQMFLRQVGNRLLPRQAKALREKLRQPYPKEKRAEIALLSPMPRVYEYPIELCGSIYPQFLNACLEPPSAVARPRLMQKNFVNPFHQKHTHREVLALTADVTEAILLPLVLQPNKSISVTALGDVQLQQPLRPQCLPATETKAKLMLTADSPTDGRRTTRTFRVPPWKSLLELLTAVADCLRKDEERVDPWQQPFPHPTEWAPYGWRVQVVAEFPCVEAAIPETERYRVDLIRSYTAMILDIGLGQTQCPPGFQYHHAPAHRRRVFPIHRPTDPYVPLTDTNRDRFPWHQPLPVGHFCVRFDSVSDLRTTDPDRARRREFLFCVPESGGEQWVSYLFLEHLLRLRLVVPTEVQGFVPTCNALAEQKLAATLVTYVLYVLEHPDLQTFDKEAGERDATKPLINHLIGFLYKSCTQTYTYHSGPMEEDSFPLVYTWLRVKSLHPTADVHIVSEHRQLPADPRIPLLAPGSIRSQYVCAKEYTPKVLQVDAVYRMILEMQAIRMYELMWLLPLGSPTSSSPAVRPIQTSIDAFEYQKPTGDNWTDEIRMRTVDPSGLTPAELLHRGYLGRWKPEPPRGAHRQAYYEPRPFWVKENTLLARFQRQTLRYRPSLLDPHPLQICRPEEEDCEVGEEMADTVNSNENLLPLPGDGPAFLSNGGDPRLPVANHTPVRLTGQYLAVHYRHDIAAFWLWTTTEGRHPAALLWDLRRLLTAYHEATSQPNYLRHWPGLRPAGDDPTLGHHPHVLWDHPTHAVDPKRATRRLMWYHANPEVDPRWGDGTHPLLTLPGAFPNPLDQPNQRSETLRHLLALPTHAHGLAHRPQGVDAATLFDADRLLHTPNYAGILLQGPAGVGKTTAGRAMVDFAQTELQQVVVSTAYTHQACLVMGPHAHTLHHVFRLPHSDNPNFILQTFLFERYRYPYIDLLVVDELSMIPNVLWLCLLIFHRIRPHTRILLIGDPYQLPPVKDPELRTLLQQHQRWRYLQNVLPFPEEGDCTTQEMCEDEADLLHTVDELLDVDIVAPQWQAQEYLGGSTLLMDLLWDHVHHIPGTWIQLHGCRRTDDPLLVQLSADPWGAVSHLRPETFPPAFQRPGFSWENDTWQPPLRYLSPTNALRMVLNWNLTCRWLWAHPEAQPRRVMDLEALYEHERRHPHRHRRKAWAPYETYLETHGSTQYLQNSLLAPGMHLLCRTNGAVRTYADGQRSQKGPKIPLYNNRLAVVVALADEPPAEEGGPIQTTLCAVRIRWADGAPDPVDLQLPTHDLRLGNWDPALVDQSGRPDNDGGTEEPKKPEDQVDVMRQARDAAQKERKQRMDVRKEEDPKQKSKRARFNEAPVPMEEDGKKKIDEVGGGSTPATHTTTTDDIDRSSFWISAFDAGFSFIPAFATTIHTAQGTGIAVPHGIGDWHTTVANPPLGYVAVTRAVNAEDRVAFVVPTSLPDVTGTQPLPPDPVGLCAYGPRTQLPPGLAHPICCHAALTSPPNQGVPPRHTPYPQRRLIEHLFQAWFWALIRFIQRMAKPRQSLPTTDSTTTLVPLPNNNEDGDPPPPSTTTTDATVPPLCELPDATVDPLDVGDVRPRHAWDAPLFQDFERCLARLLPTSSPTTSADDDLTWSSCHECGDVLDPLLSLVIISAEDGRLPDLYLKALVDPKDPLTPSGQPTRMPYTVVRLCKTCAATAQ